MNVITAPQPFDMNEISVFLAGGITNCPWWQDELIHRLSFQGGNAMLDPDKPHKCIDKNKPLNATILNPRRKDFPMDDPEAAQQQIAWEYKALRTCTVFSMWFCAGPSVQPICTYELGRHLALYCDSSVGPKHVIVGIEPGYLREQDVRIRTRLACSYVADRITSSLEAHALQIEEALRSELFQQTDPPALQDEELPFKDPSMKDIPPDGYILSPRRGREWKPSDCHSLCPGCFCTSGFLYEELCSDCRDFPNRSRTSRCVCTLPHKESKA